MAWVTNHTTGIATNTVTGATFQAAPPAYSPPAYSPPAYFSAPAPAPAPTSVEKPIKYGK